MLRRVALFAAVLCFAFTGSATAQRATAQYFVAELVGRAGMVIRDTSLSPFERRERFRAMLEQRFDLPALARDVLGRHWRTATAAERAEFTTAFADYMVAIYAPRIAAYGEPAFTVLGQRVERVVSDAPDSTATVIVTVSSTVARRDGGPETFVEWRTAPAADAYKITDVIVSGVSLMQVKRAEIGSVVDWSDGHFTRLLDGATALIRCG